ncbi:MAG: DUF11 domain-containing protein [Gemmataceae bacterium]|nr:DUF11 domain-containing protein [Gemmataceae bacterium]
MSARSWLRELQARLNGGRPGDTGRLRRKKFRPGVELLEERRVPAIIIVTSANDDTTDDSVVTLREAIKSINLGENFNDEVAAVGTYGTDDTINFNISGSGTQTIFVGSALDAIMRAVKIDGSTQPGYVDTPLIEVDGADTASLFYLKRGTGSVIQGLSIVNSATAGIRIETDDNQIIGNVISDNQGSGLFLTSGATGNLVRGNFIGTDELGTTARPNGGDGVTIADGAHDNAIGALGGTVALGNKGNLISGNASNGVSIVPFGGATPYGNEILGNYIGTGADGKSALDTLGGNYFDGVHITDSDNNRIVGNVIALNEGGTGGQGGPRSGVVLEGSGTYDTLVAGNFIGVGVDGLTPLGNVGAGVDIFNGAYDNQIGGPDGVGLQTEDPDTIARGNLISANTDDGVAISDTATTGNLVQGNFIGTTLDGEDSLPNGGNGVGIYDAPGNTLVANLISGNNRNGVLIFGDTASFNRLEGNFIGTDKDGTTALANQWNGVEIDSGTQNTIGALSGGTTLSVAREAGSGNLISGNIQDGIRIACSDSTYQGNSDADNNRILGNMVGPNLAGTGGLLDAKGLDTGRGNGWDGVHILQSDYTLVIGNVISLNEGQEGALSSGVVIEGWISKYNRVLGNFIGTNIDGTHPLRNIGAGVDIFNGAHDNQIGGPDGVGLQTALTLELEPQNSEDPPIPIRMGNLISGNTGAGVSIIGDSSAGTGRNFVQGNYIGTAIDGTSAIANADGVYIESSSDNIIGEDPNDITGSAGNTIAHNKGTGAVVTESFGPATGNAILGNSIFENDLLGIDLGNDDVTANDTDDGDVGPNEFQNFPIITKATRGDWADPTKVTIEGMFQSMAGKNYRIEFFVSLAGDASSPNGEGQTFIGAVTTTGFSGFLDFTGQYALTFTGVPVGQAFVAATATDIEIQESELPPQFDAPTPRFSVPTTLFNTSEFSPYVEIPQADLSVTKKVNNPLPNEGELISYSIVVSNAGPSNATNVVLHEDLPAGVTFVAAGSTTGAAQFVPDVTGNGGTFTFNVAAGDSITLVLWVTVDAGTLGQTLVNTAEIVSADSFDPVLTNNQASAKVLVGPIADVGVVETVDRDPTAANESLVYTIVVTNHGPSAAQNVTLTEVLPANVSLDSIVVPSGWTFIVQPNGDGTTTIFFSTGTLLPAGSSVLALLSPQVSDGPPVRGEFPVLDPLPDVPPPVQGAPAVFRVNVRVKPDVADGDTIVAHGDVTSDTSDPNLDNNDSSVTNTVVNPPPIPVPDPDPVPLPPTTTPGFNPASVIQVLDPVQTPTAGRTTTGRDPLIELLLRNFDLVGQDTGVGSADNLVAIQDVSRTDERLSQRASTSGSLTGRIFEDLNGNGKQDLDEPGWEGMTFYLSRSEDEEFDATKPLAVSDSNGEFRFENLAPGTYIVRPVASRAHQTTHPEEGLHRVTIAPDGSSTVLFGARAVRGRRRIMNPPSSAAPAVRPIPVAAVEVPAAPVALPMPEVHPEPRLLDMLFRDYTSEENQPLEAVDVLSAHPQGADSRSAAPLHGDPWDQAQMSHLANLAAAGLVAVPLAAQLRGDERDRKRRWTA